MKILVPVDGSKYSMEAVKVASDFAKLKKADITLITVTPFIPGVDLEISAKEMASLNESMKRRGEEVLEKAKVIFTAEGITFQTVLFQPSPRRMRYSVLRKRKKWTSLLSDIAASAEMRQGFSWGVWLQR